MGKVRSHYDNLQVARNASAEVIRAAYKSLSQKWHPDRHPPDKRAHCTQVMTMLNRAYEVLSDPASRAEHDKWIHNHESAGTHAQSEHDTSAELPEVSDEDVRCVDVRLDQLPEEVRAVLLAAANGSRAGHLGVRIETIGSAVFQLIVAAGGLAVMVLWASSERWSSSELYWAFAAVAALTYWAVDRGLVIRAVAQSPLRYRLFVTRTHIVESDDVVARIWTLLGTTNFFMTVHSRNGVHTHSEIDFKHLSGINAVFSIDDEYKAKDVHNEVIQRLNEFSNSLPARLKELSQSPLFRIWQRVPPSARATAWSQRLHRLWTAGLIALALHATVIVPVNSQASTYVGLPPARAQAVAPRTSAPETPFNPSPEPQPASLPLPITGWVHEPSEPLVAPFVIHADQFTNYYIKIIRSGRTIGELFLRGNETLSVEVPLGNYQVRYAYGGAWYGEKALFGKNTRYSEFDRIISFNKTYDGVDGYEIRMTKQANGNLGDRRLTPEDF